MRYLGQTVQIKDGSNECLTKNRKWDTVPPCSYSIDVSQMTSCTDLMIAANISSRIIYDLTTDSSEEIIEEGSWEEIIDNENNSTRSDSWLDCNSFPIHLVAMQIWAKGRHVTTVLSFDTVELVSVERELQITFSTGQKVISEKEYTGLSKFWTTYYFGDCLYRQCWRDMWDIIPDELIDGTYAILKSDEVNLFRWGFLLPIFLVIFTLLVVSFVYEDVESM